ncbi:hypothetical protein [Legionella waltersii]|uniref:Transmembrane protein n=1 Tax=Legionella waltersii TaxID=66969 RepID=A0A0W1A4L9_9GAMM|nr:hypothetical protein [Legionella waltersii]KTD76311.1 hypothetical protein Lwal_2033 [Legionella waltersii]SNV13625.1 Uncharacterised protein [Legionella waltersii]
MSKYTTMNVKNIPFKPKKLPYYISVILLTVGASLILGFLSFSGMYALMPLLPLAFGAFALSVGYEGEIYLQNIKGALNKLFKFNYLENHLAKDYLLGHFPDTKEENCPQFFKDYQAQLKLLAQFGHKELDASSKKKKKQVEKTLSDMEKWFAQQLFLDKQNSTKKQTAYAEELQRWLAAHEQAEWNERLEKRRLQFNLVRGFSVTAGLFMGLGTTYLIVEAFTVIPFFAAIPFAFWPVIILPMAVVAGAAYGMLTYNTITDMINNDTVMKWYKKLRDDFKKGITLRNLFLGATAVLLVSLALALTICTAGTWWTIATNARPLFDWMKNMPSFIMGVINPIITGVSAIFFNVQNSAESLQMVDDATNSDHAEKQKQPGLLTRLGNWFSKLREDENWAQIFNPFRIILKLTVTPLRIVLFLGHLLSIAVTADRMPGVPQILAALVAIISEGFEDAHYFFGHDHNHDEEEHSDHQHEHGHDHQHHQDDFNKLLKERLDPESGHNHNMDIPTWAIKTIAAPVYALAALWDCCFSSKAITYTDAWNKQRGNPIEHHVELKATSKRPSQEWQVEHTVSLIEKYQRKHLDGVLIGKEAAASKSAHLNQLKEDVLNPSRAKPLSQTFKEARNDKVYNAHRMFSLGNENTETQTFIEELPERVFSGPQTV